MGNNFKKTCFVRRHSKKIFFFVRNLIVLHVSLWMYFIKHIYMAEGIKVVYYLHGEKERKVEHNTICEIIK